MIDAFGPFDKFVVKPDAVIKLASRLGEPTIDPYLGPVNDIIQNALRRVGPLRNFEIEAISAEVVDKSSVKIAAKGFKNVLGEPRYLNGRPASFPSFVGPWPNESPDLEMIEVEEGFLCLIPDAPVVFDLNRCMVQNFSSKYSGLLYFYNCSVASILSQAIYIDGTAISIMDDVFGLNYCHWICDWITRLAPFAERLSQPDFYILVSPITTDWQLRTLELCGVEKNRIIPVAPWQAVQAHKLIVLSDVSNIRHPAQRGATWAMSFLHTNIASSARMLFTSPYVENKKIYISRSDASGRRIENEVELLKYLSGCGYKSVVLSEMSFEEQIKTFSNATHVIGIHGAGLTNIVFCNRGTTVLEILPETYGTPAFCVLALAGGMSYCTYICNKIVSNSRSQLDDLHIDLEDFFKNCLNIL